jgi:protein O-GlcNAc transferase
MNNISNTLHRAQNLHAKGQLKSAINLYSKIILKDNTNSNVFYLLGTAYIQLGLFEKALSNLEKSINLNPNNSHSYNVKGIALNALKKFEEAIVSYKHAIKLRPDNFQAFNNMGISFKALQKFKEALLNYKEAIKLNPTYAEAFKNYGNVFSLMGNFEEALLNYKEAIKLNPTYVEALRGEAVTLEDLKRHEESNEVWEKIFKINPQSDYVIGNIIHNKMQLCDWKDVDKQIAMIKESLKKKLKVIGPFILLGLIDEPNYHKLASQIYCSDEFSKFIEKKKLIQYKNHKKIKIGYFSAEFHQHPVLQLMMDIYKNHNKSKFEIYGFSHDPDSENANRDEAKKYFDKFIDVTKMNDIDIVKLGREMEIDIAINLTGHTENARGRIFSLRVAPVQINFLGFPGTMGLATMDYILSDETIIPKDKKNNYTEDILYLPFYQPNPTNIKLSQKKFERKDFNLPINSFIFCCFNNNYKITPKIFQSWMKILIQVEGSILWLNKKNEKVTSNLRMEAKQLGVNPNRIIFAPRMPLMEDHLERYKFVDLFLDTFPYNAHTTASDAIRMGTPIVTLMGQSFASRVASSILKRIDLAELITHDLVAYEKLAISLAKNSEKLNDLKSRLRDSSRRQKLFNSKEYTKDLEKLYESLV